MAGTVGSTPTGASPPGVSFVLDPAWSGAVGSAIPRHISVAIPRSLPELKQVASLTFDPSGRSSRMRMFHHGRELHHPLAVESLKDGDVVTVRLEKPPLQVAADRVLTTHQADFVKHPTQSRTLPSNDDGGAAVGAALRGRRCEGQSSYSSDYVRHHDVERPESVNGQVKYSTHWLSTPRGTDRTESTYNSLFPWHDSKPGASGVSGAVASVLSDASRGHVFSARSTYADEYQHREAQPPTMPFRASASVVTEQARGGAFSGASQYAADFVKHSGDCRQPSARPDRSDYSYQPFEANSEYRQQFVARSGAKTPLVHLKNYG